MPNVDKITTMKNINIGFDKNFTNIIVVITNNNVKKYNQRRPYKI